MKHCPTESEKRLTFVKGNWDHERERVNMYVELFQMCVAPTGADPGFQKGMWDILYFSLILKTGALKDRLL